MWRFASWPLTFLTIKALHASQTKELYCRRRGNDYSRHDRPDSRSTGTPRPGYAKPASSAVRLSARREKVSRTGVGWEGGQEAPRGSQVGRKRRLMSAKPAIHFSRHSRNRMRFWHVSQNEVIAVLNDPDQVTSSRKGRLNAWKRTGKQWVRVTYISEGARTVVVTVTARPRGPEGR